MSDYHSEFEKMEIHPNPNNNKVILRTAMLRNSQSKILMKTIINRNPNVMHNYLRSRQPAALLV